MRTLDALGCWPCASLPAWLSALATALLFAPAPWDADVYFVESTEVKLEAIFPCPLPNAT